MQIKLNNWPTFIVVGAPRSGTTSLFRHLRSLKSVYLPEVKYITHFRGNNYSPQLNEKEYLEHFSNVTTEKIIGEVNPGYLSDPDSPKLIKKKIPDVKIIILLRDPIERTFSEYISDIAKEKINCSFSDAILENPPPVKDFPNTGLCQKNNILERSLYYEQVKRFFEIFGRENVGIWFVETLKENPISILQQIYGFLGITDEVKDMEQEFGQYSIPRNSMMKFILRNKQILKILRKIIPSPKLRESLSDFSYKKISKPVMLKKDRILLEEYFRKDTSNLHEILNMEIPWRWVKHSQQF